MRLVFGNSGQVATMLRSQPDVMALGRDECDLLIRQDFHKILRKTGAKVVINAAAYTHVDKAESDASAFRLNAEVPGEIAKACDDLSLPFIHLSTDYVFDGSGNQPWRPVDSPHPINKYGLSKLEGENAVRVACENHTIIRTSWTFSKYGSNFVNTILSVLNSQPNKKFLEVVDDQIGGPTPAESIAFACLRIAEQMLEHPGCGGTHHFSGWPDVSRADFAEHIITELGHKAEILRVSSSSVRGNFAPRPLNSRLACGSMSDVFGIKRPRWREALLEVIKSS